MPNYTASEDVRDVLQLIAAILARPCVNGKNAVNARTRATAVTYGELQMMKKRLHHALEIIEKSSETGFVNRMTVAPGEFVRPMGVPQLDVFPPHRCVCEGEYNSACPVHGENRDR